MDAKYPEKINNTKHLSQSSTQAPAVPLRRRSLSLHSMCLSPGHKARLCRRLVFHQFHYLPSEQKSLDLSTKEPLRARNLKSRLCHEYNCLITKAEVFRLIIALLKNFWIIFFPRQTIPIKCFVSHRPTNPFFSKSM